MFGAAAGGSSPHASRQFQKWKRRADGAGMAVRGGRRGGQPYCEATGGGAAPPRLGEGEGCLAIAVAGSPTPEGPVSGREEAAAKEGQAGQAAAGGDLGGERSRREEERLPFPVRQDRVRAYEQAELRKSAFASPVGAKVAVALERVLGHGVQRRRFRLEPRRHASTDQPAGAQPRQVVFTSAAGRLVGRGLLRELAQTVSQQVGHAVPELVGGGSGERRGGGPAADDRLVQRSVELQERGGHDHDRARK
jgi:hypothetical protein